MKMAINSYMDADIRNSISIFMFNPYHIDGLIHLPSDQMPQFWQTTFSNEFSWMKMIELQQKYVPRSTIDK